MGDVGDDPYIICCCSMAIPSRASAGRCSGLCKCSPCSSSSVSSESSNCDFHCEASVIPVATPPGKNTSQFNNNRNKPTQHPLWKQIWRHGTSTGAGDLLQDGGIIVLGDSTLCERRIAIADVAVAHHNTGAPIAARTLAVRVHTVKAPQVRPSSNGLLIKKKLHQNKDKSIFVHDQLKRVSGFGCCKLNQLS